MLYLSNLLGKQVYFEGRPFGRILDIAVLHNFFLHPLSKILVKKRNGENVELSASAVDFAQKPFVVKTLKKPVTQNGDTDFYLKEHLLDKQVIDIEGKRLVRVNEVLLDNGTEPTLVGIDIGLSGILWRLCLGKLTKLLRLKPKILPWQLIEAFDFQKGAIRIKLRESKLNFLHHSELADILQEVGTKERIGILESLSPQKAALALQETNPRTQSLVLEQLSSNSLETIVQKMQVSRIADILYKLNHFKIKEILQALGTEKAEIVQSLSLFDPDTAGGLMVVRYYRAEGDRTVQDIMDDLEIELHPHPEIIVVTDKNKKFLGLVQVKHLFYFDPAASLQSIIENRKSVYPEVHAKELIKLFSQYDLRILPVVNHTGEILGVVTIDRLLQDFEKEDTPYAI